MTWSSIASAEKNHSDWGSATCNFGRLYMYHIISLYHSTIIYRRIGWQELTGACGSGQIWVLLRRLFGITPVIVLILVLYITLSAIFTGQIAKDGWRRDAKHRKLQMKRYVQKSGRKAQFQVAPNSYQIYNFKPVYCRIFGTIFITWTIHLRQNINGHPLSRHFTVLAWSCVFDDAGWIKPAPDQADTSGWTWICGRNDNPIFALKPLWFGYSSSM